MIEVAIKRSAQSVLHLCLPREEADRLGQQIANRLCDPATYQQAAQRYATEDPIEIGEAAAKEYLRLVNQAG